MKLRHLLYFFLVIELLNFSCTPYKNVPYFQDLKQDSVVTEKINNFTPLTIQPGDLLALHVTSMNKQADEIFNYNLGSPSGINNVTGEISNGTPSENAVFGYLVSREGNMHLPMIGDVNVAGKSTEEIASDLEGRLSEVLTKPIVSVRIVNFKISILGDVKTPGSYTIQNESVTLPEAMALAGDLNTTGKRENVLLVREINGTRKYIRIDLKSKDIFASPYYYLKNKDVLYVQPNRDKVSSTDSFFEKTSLILAALSVIAIFLTIKK